MQVRTFYRCGICGNLFEIINDSGVNPVCCNQPMNLLEPNTSDGAGEKHVPALMRNGKHLKVQVGSVIHPMTEEHHIQWIMVRQGDHVQRVSLHPGDQPIVEFALEYDANPVLVYEYCNLHGLWSAES